MFTPSVLWVASKPNADGGFLRQLDNRAAQIQRPEKQPKSPTKCLIAAVSKNRARKVS